MKEIRRFSFLVMVLVLSVFTVDAQFAHGGYVSSMAGGEATGGNFSTTFVAGDPAASEAIANGDLFGVYPGFIPGNFIILSFGLRKDSTVLAVLYEATRGDEWENAQGWLQNPTIGNWNGITVKNQRVTAIELDSNNVQGAIPAIINNLSKLDTLILSRNNLRSLPSLSGLSSLVYLDVSQNRLGFADLINNLDTGLTTYEYVPQRRFGFTRNDTVSAGSDTVRIASIPGVGNNYQWIFDDLGNEQDSIPIPGATGTTLFIDSVTYEKMGAYRLVATNPALPDLTLQTRNQNLWATTTLKGTVFADNQGTLLDDGQIKIYRIVNDGPFVLSDSAFINTDGTYEIKDLVLGDFILRSDPNTEVWDDVIQTYYVSTDDWINADTLVVRSVIDNIDIQMVFKPVYVQDPLGGTINGLVETDFDTTGVDEEASRIDARRKVKKAGCSLRRRTRSGGGRGEQEEDEFVLYAYVESDDNGQFTFPEIEEGVYRLNIQYPGVPMDETSAIEFTIGGDVQEQVFQVTATVTEDGIVVESEEILSVKKPYIKDVLVYPNPTSGPFAAEYIINRRIKDLSIQLRTLQGSLIYGQQANIRMGAYRAEMDLSRLPAGIYFLSFSDQAGSFNHQVKLIKE